MILQQSDPISFAPPFAAALAIAGLVLLSKRPRTALLTSVGLGLAIGVWVLLWYAVSVSIGPFGIDLISGWPVPVGWISFSVNFTSAIIAWVIVAAGGAFVARNVGLQRDRAIVFAVIWFSGFIVPLMGHGGLVTSTSRALFIVSGLLAVALAVILVRSGRGYL